MALIAFDATSKGLTNFNTTFDISHTVQNVLGHPYIFVVTDPNVTSVVWNGNESFTHLRTWTPTFPSGTNCPQLRVWGLAPTATGTHNISVTSTGATPVAVISFSTADPAQPAAYNENSTNNFQEATWAGSVTTTQNQQWVICFAALVNSTSCKFGAGSGATLRVQTDGSFFVFQKFAILDLNAEKDVGTYSVNINILNNADNQSSDFVSTLTFAMEPYRTNVTPTFSEQTVYSGIPSPTVTAIKNVTVSPSVQALRFYPLTVIPDTIVEIGTVQALTFTTLQSGVRTARFSTKYPSNGDSYQSKYTRRV